MADRVIFQTDDDLSEANLKEWLGRKSIGDYVAYGIGFTNVDYAAPETDISAGRAHLLVDGKYDATVIPDARSNVSLTDGDTNYVYLNIDFSSQDVVSYKVNTTGTEPSNGTSLLVGTIDTSADTADDSINRDPVGSFREITGDVAGGKTLSSLTGTNLSINGSGELESTGAMASISDSGSQILSSPGDIDFGQNVSVTDDGDGTVTVDVSDQATSDTRVNVSNDGTQVVSEPTDVNFGQGLTASDDGDGTATVAAGSIAAPDAEDDGSVVVSDSTAFNFATGLTVTDDGDQTVTVDNDVAQEYQNDGSKLADNPSIIDFDANVTASYDSNNDEITIKASSAQPNVEDDGSEIVTGASAINFAAGASVTDDGDGTVTVDVDEIQQIIESPNYSTGQIELKDTEAHWHPVPVPDTHTLEIYRWGCWDDSESAPSGLTVAWAKGGPTLQSSTNTTDSAGSAGSPLVSSQNSSGSFSTWYVGVKNGTGSDILASNNNWIVAHFGFRVVA